MGTKPLQNVKENKTTVFMCSDSDIKNISDQSSWCGSISRGALGAVHSVGKIPIRLMNVWKTSTDLATFF